MEKRGDKKVNISLILSGGTGSRMGGNLPKQYQSLEDREIIAYTIDALKSSLLISKVVVVAAGEYVKELADRYDVDTTIGGDSRNASLRNGLEYIAANFPMCEKIFINEAARPFVTTKVVDEYLDLLDQYDAVITTQPITDSLGKEGEAVTDRSQYYLIQAPEAFQFNILYEHFRAESPITATSQQLPSQSRVYRNFEFRNNLKITYPEDLMLAEQLMRCLQ
ncbi:IspD/TarI family cytidylyltransferase [Lacrimispora sp.]|jgi:2-C-methyl-D-erythritol 4-phosphate cytidylyltransferase|uniref:IspD/TarI family cytidylyltransferase n=1 Tax=Lacrimispora sp. TaxID=2719234 RepID=UPI0028A16561|nr:2-C-methyl-D-erythritol 4-phosphate cytidylyltransferase [Lacrimispora sp.]